MRMDRRTFLLTSGLTGISLFLPKTFQPAAWKRMTPLWDYQIALYNATGEFQGAGYKRALVRAGDFFRTKHWHLYPDWQEYSLRKIISHPPSIGKDAITGFKILDRYGKPVYSTPIYPALAVPDGVIVQYNPGDIRLFGPLLLT